MLSEKNNEYYLDKKHERGKNMNWSIKDLLENIFMWFLLALCGIGGFVLILILQPWFWLAIIALTLIVYIF